MPIITERQKKVITFIANYIRTNSYPPTIREIAEHFEISVKGAHDHVIALTKKGFLRQSDTGRRTLEVTGVKFKDAELQEIPILGTVAAGMPLMAEENFDGNIMLHRSMLKKNKTYFALTVKGDSMSGVGILEGDTAVIEKTSTVKNGEIAVALIGDDSVTLKRFFKEAARIRLQSENPAYKHIYSNDVKILGRLFTIIRSY